MSRPDEPDEPDDNDVRDPIRERLLALGPLTVHRHGSRAASQLGTTALISLSARNPPIVRGSSPVAALILVAPEPAHRSPGGYRLEEGARPANARAHPGGHRLLRFGRRAVLTDIVGVADRVGRCGRLG